MGLSNADLFNPRVRIDAVAAASTRDRHSVAPTDRSGNNVALATTGNVPYWLADAGDGFPAYVWDAPYTYNTGAAPRTVITLTLQPDSLPGVRTLLAARSVGSSAFGRALWYGSGQSQVQLESFSTPPQTIPDRLQTLSAEDQPFTGEWHTRAFTFESGAGDSQKLRSYLSLVDASDRNGVGSNDARNNWGVPTGVDQVAIGGNYDNSRVLSAGMRGMLVRTVLIYDTVLTPAQVRQVSSLLNRSYRPASLRTELIVNFGTGDENFFMIFGSGDGRYLDAIQPAYTPTFAGQERTTRDPSGLIVGNDFIFAHTSPVRDPWNQTAAAFGDSVKITCVSAIPVSDLAKDDPQVTQRTTLEWDSLSGGGQSVSRAWAPQLINDGGTVYGIISIAFYATGGSPSAYGVFQPHYRIALDGTLANWGPAIKLPGTAFNGINLIDTIIVKRNGSAGYRCFVKDDSLQRIGYTDSPNFLGPYNTPITWVSPTLDQGEGQFVVPQGGDVFDFWVDDYNNNFGGGFQFRRSTNNLDTFGPRIRPKQIHKARHGDLIKIPISDTGHVTAAALNATGDQITLTFDRDLQAVLPPRATGFKPFIRVTPPSGIVRNEFLRVSRVVRTGGRTIVVYLATRIASAAVPFIGYQGGNLSYLDNSAMLEFAKMPVSQSANTTTALEAGGHTAPLSLVASNASVTNAVVRVSTIPANWPASDLGGVRINTKTGAVRYTTFINTYGGSGAISLYVGRGDDDFRSSPAFAVSRDGRAYTMELRNENTSDGNVLISARFIDEFEQVVVGHAFWTDDTEFKNTAPGTVSIDNWGGPGATILPYTGLTVYERALLATVPGSPAAQIVPEGDGLLLSYPIEAGDSIYPRSGAEGWALTVAGTLRELGIGSAIGSSGYFYPVKSGVVAPGAAVTAAYVPGNVADNGTPSHLLAAINSFAVTNNSGNAGGGTNTVADPTFSPPPGTVAAGGTIFATCDTPSAIIRFTLDDTDPTEGSPELTTPIVIIPEGRNIKARAFRAGFVPSAIVSGSWTLGVAALTGGTITVPAGQTGVSSLYVLNTQSPSGGSGAGPTYIWFARVGGVWQLITGITSIGNLTITAIPAGADRLRRRATRGSETADAEVAIELVTGGGGSITPGSADIDFAFSLATPDVMDALPAASREYLKVVVVATSDGVSVDPKTFSVRFGFAQGALPSDPTWHIGEWSVVDGKDVARLMIGPSSPGQIVFTPGAYNVFVRVDNAPEQTIRRLPAIRVV